MDTTTQETREALEEARRAIAAARSRLQHAASAGCELAELMDDEVLGPLIDAEGAAERLLALARFKP